MASSSEGRGRKLLDRASDAPRNAGFDSANATGYVSWMRQYILFHDKRHPQQMRIPVYNRKWHNYFPNTRLYHSGHHFILHQL